MGEQYANPCLHFPECPTDLRTESERVHVLLENAKQLLGTMKATFPNYSFEPTPFQPSCEVEASTDLEKAQCAWSHVHKLLHHPNDGEKIDSQLRESLLHFLGISQGVMSSTAANYDLNKLYLGLLITGVAILLAFPTTYKLMSESKYPGLFLVFSILSYGGMMFASSYVEEEQQFWYWIFTGWTFYLHVKSARQQRKHSLISGYLSRAPSFSAICTIGLAITYRILRRWNQTGQKFAAEPDITRTFFPSHQNIFWVLVILTYVETSRSFLFSSPGSLAWRLTGFLTTLAAFGFKITFVASDSPELLGESFLAPVRNMLGGMSLILQARTVFCGVAMMIVLAAFVKRGNSGATGKRNGKPPCVNQRWYFTN